MQQVTDWLEKLGLGQYAQRFAENDISFSVLPGLENCADERVAVCRISQFQVALVLPLAHIRIAEPCNTALDRLPGAKCNRAKQTGFARLCQAL